MATVSMFAGLVFAVGAAGCSQEEAEAVSASADGGSDARGAKKDTGASPEVEGDDEACYSDDKIDVSTVVYKPARVQAGACSKDVFDKIKNIGEALGGRITAAELKDGLAMQESEKCADCVFAEDGEEWAPVVMEGDQIKVLNFVGCVEVKSGSVACGEAYFRFRACISEACKDCSSVEVQGCVAAVRSTACGDAIQATKEACGDKVDAYINECGSAQYVFSDFGGSIQELCVGNPIADAGSDADAN